MWNLFDQGHVFLNSSEVLIKVFGYIVAAYHFMLIVVEIGLFMRVMHVIVKEFTSSSKYLDILRGQLSVKVVIIIWNITICSWWLSIYHNKGIDLFHQILIVHLIITNNLQLLINRLVNCISKDYQRGVTKLLNLNNLSN